MYKRNQNKSNNNSKRANQHLKNKCILRKNSVSALKFSRFFFFNPRHYKPLTIIFNIILPTLVPWYFWNEALLNSFFVCFAFRYAYLLNVTWSVNSFAHIWGSRPYDETISPSQNLVANLGTLGEGYHNFHHCFPQDYAASELGTYINLSKFVIDCFALVGLAYDLKTTSKEAVFQRRRRTGDLRNQKHQGDKYLPEITRHHLIPFFLLIFSSQ